MVPALVKAGLPATSVVELIAAISGRNTAAVAAVPGVTNETVAIAAAEFKAAYSNAFQTVFLASIAFGTIAFIASFWAPSLDGKLTNEVLRQLGTSAKNGEGIDVEKSVGDKMSFTPEKTA